MEFTFETATVPKIARKTAETNPFQNVVNGLTIVTDNVDPVGAAMSFPLTMPANEAIPSLANAKLEDVIKLNDTLRKVRNQLFIAGRNREGAPVTVRVQITQLRYNKKEIVYKVTFWAIPAVVKPRKPKAGATSNTGQTEESNNVEQTGQTEESNNVEQTGQTEESNNVEQTGQ